MVKLTNNFIIVTNDDNSYLPLKVNFKKVIPEKTVRLKNGKRIRKPSYDFYYYAEQDNCLIIPIGLLFFAKHYFNNSEIIDVRDTFDYDIKIDVDYYKHLLPDITLRQEQVIAIRKALLSKRGIIQLPTGSGKTEIMCGIIKALYDLIGEIPTTLVLEPTLNLVNSTVSRFTKYGIPAISYSKEREIKLNTVNVCHPSALSNDMEKDIDILNDIIVLLCDETHHFNAETFRKPTREMPNLLFSIGVSASAISQNRVGCENISDYEISEILTFSATGQLLINIITGDLIEDNKLANPVLLRMKHIANEELPDDDITNWHNISKIRLESESRNNLIALVSKFFVDNDRKVLILVRTIRWARLLLKEFYELDLQHNVGGSYGSGKLERYNGYDYVNDETILDRFSNGDINVLIGTTHLYEGADIPNLDCIVLAYGGKGERIQIQGIGRALRLTKNGKYAYIVDFTDDEDVVLSKHSNQRYKRYKEIIGIPENQIFNNVSIYDIEEIFERLEK